MADTMDIDFLKTGRTAADLRRLIIAARVVAYLDDSREAIKELDEAVEAFSEDVPWDDTPEQDRL